MYDTGPASDNTIARSDSIRAGIKSGSGPGTYFLSAARKKPPAHESREQQLVHKLAMDSASPFRMKQPLPGLTPNARHRYAIALYDSLRHYDHVAGFKKKVPNLSLSGHQIIVPDRNPHFFGLAV